LAFARVARTLLSAAFAVAGVARATSPANLAEGQGVSHAKKRFVEGHGFSRAKKGRKRFTQRRKRCPNKPSQKN
jgi:hypothetical protein